MHISEKNNLNIRGHKDIEFVDINLDTDIELYIDPSLVDSIQTEWCLESSKVIINFFDNVFECCKNKNFKVLHGLLEFGKEPNETKFGLSISQSCGKGSKPESLFKIFKSVSDACFIEKNMVKNASDLCIFVKNFAEDRMSDLLTNILRKQLYLFTLSQCKKHNINLSDETHNIGRYWDAKEQKWKKLIGKSLLIDGVKILLVPKNIVRRRFIISASQYIQKQILTHRQAYHLETQSDLVHERYTKSKGYYLVPPTKKELYSKEIKGRDHKEFAKIYTEQNPHAIDAFRNNRYVNIGIEDYILPDSKLDSFVYGKKAKYRYPIDKGLAQ